MEYLLKAKDFVKKNWPVCVLAALAVVMYFTRGNNHSFAERKQQYNNAHGIQEDVTTHDSMEMETSSKGNSGYSTFGSGSKLKRSEQKVSGKMMALSAPSEAMSDGGGSGGGSVASDIAGLVTPMAHADPSSMLIKNGAISVFVESLATAKKSLAEMVKKHGARIDNESQYEQNDAIIMNVTIKVPAAKFQALFEEALTVAKKVRSHSVNVDDIMKEYTDIKSRLENKKALQQRFRDLVKRADKMKDILEIERELARISEDIDSTEKIMKQYENDVAFSTINIDMNEPKANVDSGAAPLGIFKKIGMSFKAGFDWIVDTILEFISWWPMWLVFAGGYMYWRRLKKKSKK